MQNKSIEDETNFMDKHQQQQQLKRPNLIKVLMLTAMALG
jgi:hypothetical protein